MSNFVHLHNHSEYSLLNSTASIAALVDEGKAQGMRHLALTDFGNMFGALRFEEACRREGIHPIIGAEVEIAPDPTVDRHYLCLYCCNETGYRNLMKLTSSPVDREVLAKHDEGLIASSACRTGEIALWYQELFGEGNFYLELMDHGLPEEKQLRSDIIKLSRETGIPLIATNDIRYIKKEHASAYAKLRYVAENRKVSESDHIEAEKAQHYFKSEEEMKVLFSDVPEALTNTVRLAEKCDLVIPRPGADLPDFPIPAEYETPEEYLRSLVQEGLKKRFDSLNEELIKRADYELDTICSLGFADYFLIVWDYVYWARIQEIPVGPGRGAAAGSLVAYVLFITDVDPLKHDLLFERFLNPERVVMPDFDIDFCFDRRDEVVEYIKEKYGKERVAGICTFGTFHANPGGLYEELMQSAPVLEGLIHHVSPHPCGIVIAKTAVTDYASLYTDPDSGTRCTQYTMDFIESCGLLKFDLLGLEPLTHLKGIEKIIQKSESDFTIEGIPLDDKKTFELLSRGDTEGVFQLESSGMRDILIRARPDCFEDIIALNSLYRPGPMQFIPQLIENKSNPQNIEYPHTDLEEILKPTYGIIVYQEQIMRILERVGGLSLGKADIIRRLMGKKKEKELLKWEDDFLEGAERNGYGGKTGKEIFDLLKPFAGYGFNKAHAAAFTLIAYRTAYCRAHFPKVFRDVFGCKEDVKNAPV